MYIKHFRGFSWHFCFYPLLSLCSLIVQIVSCMEEGGAMLESENHLDRNITFHIVTQNDTTTEEPFTSTFPTPTTTVYKWPSLYDMSMGK